MCKNNNNGPKNTGDDLQDEFIDFFDINCFHGLVNKAVGIEKQASLRQMGCEFKYH